MFHLHRKQKEKIPIDPTIEQVVIRTSICTGEKTGCIQDLKTKKLRDIMLIRNQKDLEEFAQLTGQNPVEIKEIF